MSRLSLLSLGSTALFAMATALAANGLMNIPVPAAPRFGYRGEARRRAMQDSALFAAVEPLVRWLAGCVAELSPNALRLRQERELRSANHWLGVTPDEYSAVALLSAFVLGGVGVLFTRWTGTSQIFAVPAAAVGLVTPTLQVQQVIRRRAKEITRGLPHAIEIAAMCMGAGLDFVGALRFLSQPTHGERDALGWELCFILEELELGRTRRDALLAFADRVPARAVRELALAIVQSEQKGNPLAKVLQVQGRMLNMRRSVAAEEAATRAGVLMIIPLMLLFGCILSLLIGPFVARGIGF